MIEKRYDDEYWLVEHTPANGLLKVTRKAKPYGDVEEIKRSLGSLNEGFEGLEAGKLRVLLDLRDGPGRNDEAFESTMNPYRNRMLRGVRRFACLVRTAAGRLQITRISNPGTMVFLDEDEAFAYLLSDT